jgi:prepilin-type N-terminal cleavage/methylation domain-containing protein
MRGRKGFTLIELMIVVVIVAILAAIIIPLLLSRVEKSKYSEGKAIAGQIATAVRAYVAEQGTAAIGSPLLTTHLGFKLNELDGKYFFQNQMTVSGVSVNTNGQVSYVISLTPNTRSGLSTTTPLVLTCNAGNAYDPIFTPAGI